MNETLLISDSLKTAMDCAGLLSEETAAGLPAAIGDVARSLDTVWVLLAAMLVFIMQPGFALVEAGFERTKNAANILMKNLLDFSAGTILFWLFGFGVMFGPSVAGIFGTPNPTGTAGWEGDIPSAAFLVFQTMFCATAATIVSGAVAGRTKFHAYLFYCVLISAFIYPVSGHWTWGGGWLSELGFHDFAGSAVVHSVGGWLACTGALFVGPRLGKYRNGKVYAIPGHNLSLASLGVFILWFGWFGFNPGSQLAASGDANATAIGNIFLTTNISAAAGALAGITAGCDMVSPFGALCIGTISGLAMVFAVSFFDTRLKIDDPVGAISVHGVCGTLGTILTGLFALDGGLLYGGGTAMLGIQTLGALTTAGWALAAGFVLFGILKKTVGLRVDKRVEEEGLDIYEHGETAYNA